MRQSHHTLSAAGGAFKAASYVVAPQWGQTTCTPIFGRCCSNMPPYLDPARTCIPRPERAQRFSHAS
jgi:hypothetical protein